MRQFKQSLIEVKIHTNTIQKLVNSHEVPILQAIHGDDDRCHVIEEDAGYVESPATNEEEFNRLLECYPKYADAIRMIHRNPKTLGELIDESAGVAPKPKAPASAKPKAPAAPKAATEKPKAVEA
jgi:hypothetical protein